MFDESQFVNTEAVEYVEPQLHKSFPNKIVSGEWFIFPTEEDAESSVFSGRAFAANVLALKLRLIVNQVDGMR